MYEREENNVMKPLRFWTFECIQIKDYSTTPTLIKGRGSRRNSRSLHKSPIAAPSKSPTVAMKPSPSYKDLYVKTTLSYRNKMKSPRVGADFLVMV